QIDTDAHGRTWGEQLPEEFHPARRARDGRVGGRLPAARLDGAVQLEEEGRRCRIRGGEVLEPSHRGQRAELPAEVLSHLLAELAKPVAQRVPADLDGAVLEVGEAAHVVARRGEDSRLAQVRIRWLLLQLEEAPLAPALVQPAED